MKTLFFCNLIPAKLGAFEYLVYVLGQEFKKNGDVLAVVFAAEPVPDVTALLREAGVAWEAIEGWGDVNGHERPWRFCLPALRLLKKHRPDVVVVHFGNELPSLVTALLAPLAGVRGIKWVWQQHQQIQDPTGLARWLSRIRLLSLVFDHFVAVYDGGKRSFLLRRIPENRITVIYNATRDYRPSRPPSWVREECGISRDKVVIITVGWLIPRKRMDFLLRVFSDIREEARMSACLLVVGDGPERAKLEEFTSALGIHDQVRFLGARNDVRELLAGADLLVHSSLAETCTYAITESMAAGIPAVVTEAGAAREQIVDGETGFVVERDDHEGFADRLLRLINDPELRRRMGQAARARWQERYRVEVSARKYYELYKKVMSEA